VSPDATRGAIRSGCQGSPISYAATPRRLVVRGYHGSPVPPRLVSSRMTRCGEVIGRCAGLVFACAGDRHGCALRASDRSRGEVPRHVHTFVARRRNPPRAAGESWFRRCEDSPPGRVDAAPFVPIQAAPPRSEWIASGAAERLPGFLIRDDGSLVCTTSICSSKRLVFRSRGGWWTFSSMLSSAGWICGSIFRRGRGSLVRSVVGRGARCMTPRRRPGGIWIFSSIRRI
jgi:hypothetical protein